jgi:histidine ammonia-lyase
MADAEPSLTQAETRLAKLRLVAAEKAAVHRAVADGLLSTEAAEGLLAPLDERYEALQRGADSEP